MSFCGDRESWKTRREQISANDYYEDAAQQRDNETPTCVLIFLKLCMLKTKPNGSLGRSTGRANHCEH